MKTTNNSKYGFAMMALACALALGSTGCSEDPASCTLVRVENGGVSCRCLDEDGDRMGDYSKDDSRCAGLVEATDVCSFERVGNDCEATCNGHIEQFYCDDDPNSTCSLDQSNGLCRLVCTGGNTTDWWNCSGGSNPPPNCTPSNEVCNGYDDDCDGVTDEGCGNPPGCQITNGGVESCDGLDNDCDGVTDEGCGTNPPTTNYDVYAVAISMSTPFESQSWQSQKASELASCYMSASCKNSLTGSGNGTFQYLASNSYGEDYPGYTGAYAIARAAQSCLGPINIQAAPGASLFGSLKLSNKVAQNFSLTGGFSLAFEVGDQCNPVTLIALAVDGFYFNTAQAMSLNIGEESVPEASNPELTMNKVETAALSVKLSSMPVIELDGKHFYVLGASN